MSIQWLRRCLKLCECFTWSLRLDSWALTVAVIFLGSAFTSRIWQSSLHFLPEASRGAPWGKTQRILLWTKQEALTSSQLWAPAGGLRRCFAWQEGLLPGPLPPRSPPVSTLSPCWVLFWQRKERVLEHTQKLLLHLEHSSPGDTAGKIFMPWMWDTFMSEGECLCVHKRILLGFCVPASFLAFCCLVMSVVMLWLLNMVL